MIPFCRFGCVDYARIVFVDSLRRFLTSLLATLTPYPLSHFGRGGAASAVGVRVPRIVCACRPREAVRGSSPLTSPGGASPLHPNCKHYHALWCPTQTAVLFVMSNGMRFLRACPARAAVRGPAPFHPPAGLRPCTPILRLAVQTLCGAPAPDSITADTHTNNFESWLWPLALSGHARKTHINGTASFRGFLGGDAPKRGSRGRRPSGRGQGAAPA